ncbi:MAG TPA: phosphoenolpyruvate carboxykinase (GTP) [Candidatus Aquiluna sp.]|jgi:phosphoenolpyruvate carboxykinase (GTP)|nr:phosphoenolpyruvate carboxykinase (GTP) [Aquiluna sp.]
MSLATLKRWVTSIADLTDPEEIIWCDGSEAEAQRINNLLVKNETFTKLNPKIRPNSYLARTDPADVARVESRTFICSENEEDAGPTNNWMDPESMRVELKEKFAGSMRGRKMYVIPFSMGPVGSPLARYGVEISDSPYVVASMKVMARVSKQVVQKIADGADWVPAVHSVGVPLIDQAGNQLEDTPWPCNPENVYVVQFPETREIWSYGSGYGGNSLLGKKAMALRIGSVLAKQEGWLAEHMLLIRVTTDQNQKYHMAAAFPSACGKTNLAMLQSQMPGWKVETLGDDIVWMSPNAKGKIRAINPENGLFGVAPGTGLSTNLAAVNSMREGAIFTNVASTADGDVWWEGLTDTPPKNLTDWQGNAFDPESGQLAAHPNSRFCFPIDQVETLSDNWADPEGVELDAIIFGGRRATNVPLVIKSFSWDHGVFLGATIASEQTAAAEGPVGKLRRDPFAMLPFCGYNMADYFSHWLSFADKLDAKDLPTVFQVNWFRKDQNGKFLWPGFAENMRVIQWIVGQLEGKDTGSVSAIGTLPKSDSLNLEGLSTTAEQMEQLLDVDSDSWGVEAADIEGFFEEFGDRLPKQLVDQLGELKQRLSA